MTALGWAAALLGGFIVWAVVTGSVASFVATRLKRSRPTYTNLTLHLPPVPEPVDPWDELMDDLPWECLSPAEQVRRCERLWVAS